MVHLWKPVKPEGPYQTIALWQSTTCEEDDGIEDFFLIEFGTRIKRIGCVACDNGRIDFAFFVHSEDITKFATQRFKLGSDSPRWWEDIYFNDQQDEFPDDFVACYPDPNTDID